MKIRSRKSNDRALTALAQLDRYRTAAQLRTLGMNGEAAVLERDAARRGRLGR